MKSYKQYCGIASALDLIGDRWTLLIMRDLLLGPLRYGELLSLLEGITTNLLADRLSHLEKAGLVTRSDETRQAPYLLTAKGQTIEPILFALGEWGWDRMDSTRADIRKNLRWALVSIKRRLKPMGRDFVLQLSTVDSGDYVIWERKGLTRVEAGTSVAPDILVRGPSQAILGALFLVANKGSDIGLQGNERIWTDFIQHLSQL